MLFRSFAYYIAVAIFATFVLEPEQEDIGSELGVGGESAVVATVAVVLIVGLASFAEELFFRGFLQPRVGIPFSTALFVLAHLSYEQPFMLLAFRDVHPALKPAGIRPDGGLAPLGQRAAARFGYHVWTYPRGTETPSRDRVIELIRTKRCNVGLFADAGGPRGRVKRGLAAIARATNALLVPMVARGKPSLTLPRPLHHGVPLPFGAIVVHHGEPIDGSRATTEECQAALEEVDAIARRTGRAAEVALGFWERVLRDPSGAARRGRPANRRSR